MIALTKKTRNLLDKIRKGDKYSINHDMFDLEKFKYIKEHSKELLGTEELGKIEYQQFPELMQDTFDALFKNEPTLTEEWKMKPDYMLNLEIAKKLIESARYNELRVITQLDELSSALGTEIMAQQLLDWLKEAKEQREALDGLMKAAADLAGVGQEGETDEEATEEGQEGKSKSSKKMSLEQAMKHYEEQMKAFQAATNDRKFVQGIEKIAAKVKDTVRETSEMISNWGLERSGSYSKRPVNQKMELLNKLRSSSKLQQIARLAGRYRRLALQTRREKVKRGMDEQHSITQGKDLGRLIPSEWMRLKHPLTKKMFKADFIEGKTLMYEIRGKEKKAKGPIICCIDESGSMSGLPETWSKSVALALLEIAREQKRDFYVIHFSSGARMEQLHTNEFLKDNLFDIEQMIDMSEYFENGGTEFEPPLDWARVKIGEGKQWKKADIIFITDGESAVTHQWLENFNAWKKENKVSIYSVLIDSGPSTPIVLKLFSDKVEKLSSMKQDADDLAVSIFGEI
jgi:uncharacterized protein with von Willebrand factor type A (vWA) domain